MSIENFINNEVKNKKTELNSLYKTPQKENVFEMPRFRVEKPNIIHQSDILYITEDKGYKYILVIVDVYNKKLDCEPIKSLKTEDNEVFEGIKKIYSRGILSYPKFLSFDMGNEFKGQNLQDFLSSHRVNIKISKGGRHRQQAIVENANLKIGTIIHKLQANEELLTGQVVKSWVNDLKDIVKAINDNLPAIITTKQSDDLIYNYRIKNNIIPLNTNVRIKLDKPENTYNSNKLYGKFRKSDIRWSRDLYYISNILLTPNQVVMYMVNNNNSIAYTKKQLQIVNKKLTQPNPEYIRNTPDTYIVESIKDKKTENRKDYYLIKWVGFTEEHNTWEPSKTLDGSKELKDMKRLFNQNQL